MAKARYTVMFQTLLTPAQHAALSAAAAAEGVSMGDVMRDALDNWLRLSVLSSASRFPPSRMTARRRTYDRISPSRRY